MECGEVLARYSDFIDGGLKEAKRGEIIRHLKVCERCDAYQKIITDGLMAYRELEKPALSDDFYLRLQHRLFHVREGPRQEKRGATLVRGIVPTLSATFVFFFTALFLSSMSRFSSDQVETATIHQKSVGGGVAPEVSRGSVEAIEKGAPRNRVASNVRRDWDKKFIRNNMWRVLVERSSVPVMRGGLDVAGGIMDVGYMNDVIPLSVSTTQREIRRVPPPPKWTQHRELGVYVVPVSFEADEKSNHEAKKGLRVLEVQETTPARTAGILPGDTIVSFDHIPVETPEKLSQLVQSATSQTKSIQIYRLGRLIELYVDL